jgi:hypothetical protein
MGLLSPTIANFLYKISTPFSTPTAEFLDSLLNKSSSTRNFALILFTSEIKR